MAIACDMSCKRYAKTITNADCIRAMTDEELAEFIASGIPCDVCNPNDYCEDCEICVLNWLKKEKQYD